MNNEYGLSFPIIVETVTDETGTSVNTPAKPGLEDSIESSIRVILAYAINERNFLSSFGSILASLIGAPNASVSRNAVEIFVVKAIARWERRIEVADSTTTQEGEYLTVDINGFIREIQKKFNYQIIA